MGSLSPFTGILDFRKAKHLLRRASYVFSKEAINSLVGLSIEEALNELLISKANAWNEPYDPLQTSNPDGYWLSSTELPSSFTGQKRKRKIISSWWWYNALNQKTLKHKLTFFYIPVLQFLKMVELEHPLFFMTIFAC